MEEQRPTTALSRSVGARVREIRKARGMTITRLADATGIDKGVLSRYERGQRWLSDDVAMRLADALDVAPQSFFLTSPEGHAAEAAAIVDSLPAKRRPKALTLLKLLKSDDD